MKRRNRLTEKASAQGRRSLLPALSLLVAGGVVLMLPSPGSAASDPAALVGSVEGELGKLGGLLDRLVARFSQPDEDRRDLRLQRRINEGLVFFQLKEYDEAAVVLTDVVGDPTSRRSPGYSEALFHLAASLFEKNNIIGAERYFRELLNRGEKTYFKESFTRLMEISFKTGRTEGIDGYFAKLRAMMPGALDPQLSYGYGKSLYRRKRSTEALPFFLSVPSSDERYGQALYFAAVCYVQQRNYQEAMRLFQQVLDLSSSQKLDEQIVQLSHLALGRLHYETGDFTKSINRYQEIPRNSEYFGQALYEVCWTFVKRKEYEKAIRALDILLLAQPESSFAPEAKLVKGNLQLRLARYDAASTTFEEVIDEFAPMSEELGRLLTEYDDPEVYFAQMMGQDLDRFDLQVTLPPETTIWVRQEAEVGQTLSLVDELTAANDDVRESNGILERLENALKADNRLEIFPALHEGWTEALETENGLVVFKQQLNDAERGLVWEVANDAERAEYNKLKESLLTSEREFNELPRTVETLKSREAQVEDQYHKLEMRTFKLTQQIDAVKAQLVAIEKWVSDTRGKRKPGAGGRKVDDSVAQQRKEIEALYASLLQLKKQIELERGAIGIGDAVTRSENQKKKTYLSMLQQESALLGRLRGRTSASARQLLLRIDRARRSLTALDGRVRQVYQLINQRVKVEVASLKEQVKQERRRLSDYARRVTGYSGQTEHLAGRIARSGFEGVRQKFHDIVLGGDVGLIDVAWQLKQKSAVGINKLVEQRKTKFEVLDEEYEPIRQSADEGSEGGTL